MIDFRLFKLNRLKKKRTVLYNKVEGMLVTARQLNYDIPYNSKAFNILKLNQAIATIDNQLQKLTMENLNSKVEEEKEIIFLS